VVVVVGAAPPPSRPDTPQALNAACRVELLAPPPPKPPAGGVPVGFVPVPLGRCAGKVTPCFFRQDTSAVRVALEPPAEAVVEVVVDVVEELLPHAAMATVVASAAITIIRRSVRRRDLLGELMVRFLS
jgi:hypothetical protein